MRLAQGAVPQEPVAQERRPAKQGEAVLQSFDQRRLTRPLPL